MIPHTRRWMIPALLAAAAFGAGPAFGQKVVAGIEAWQAGRYEEAVHNWKPLAERGDPDAQFNLGHAYRLGRGVPQDLRKAEDHYRRSAELGHVQAQAAYGLLLFQDGRRREAMPWIERAAEAGDPRAQYVLGTALFNGDLVGTDLPRAYALMRRAADSGLPQASQQLRLMEPHLSRADVERGRAMAAEGRPPEQTAAAVDPRPRRVSGTTAATAAVAAPRRRLDAPAPAPAAATGRWRVQLGAFSNEENARRHWREVSRVSALAGLEPRYEKAGALVRLQAAGLANSAAAERACAAVKAAGKGCFTVAP